MFSIIAGILASVLPNLIFVWLYFWRGSNKPQEIVKGFYWGEVLKFAALVLLLSIFLQLPQLNVLRFFSAFLLSEMTRLFYQFFMLARTTAE
jgi:ATP synthase protein I